MNKANVIAAIVLLGSSYAAFLESERYSTYGDSRPELTLERERDIQQAVHSTRRDTQDCIAKNPADWCNRDLSDAQLVAFHTKTYDKFHPAAGPRQARNRYALLAIIAGLFLFFRLRKKSAALPSSADV